MPRQQSAEKSISRTIQERPLRFLYSFWRASTKGKVTRVAKMKPALLTTAFPETTFVDLTRNKGKNVKLRHAGRDALSLKKGQKRKLGAAINAGKTPYERVTEKHGGDLVAFSRLLLPLSDSGSRNYAMLVATARKRRLIRRGD